LRRKTRIVRRLIWRSCSAPAPALLGLLPPTGAVIGAFYFVVRVSALPEWNTTSGSPGWWSCSLIEYIVLAAEVPRLWTPVTVP
jgi:hypothetical protein